MKKKLQKESEYNMENKQIIINKNVLVEDNCKNEIYFYEKARVGFLNLLKQLKKTDDYTIFLPAYIGFSPNEGSGIDDPVEEFNYKKEFYKMNQDINVDAEDLQKKIRNISGSKILLIVHYFGYVDPNIEKIVSIAKDNNMVIIEDCAHAFYTDFIDKKCGNYGDFSIYSLHKMFPFDNGGMLKVNNSKFNFKFESTKFYDLFQYNIDSIASIRKKNAKIIYDNIKDIPEIKIIRNDFECTPQTFPILIDKSIKEKVYFKMNEYGYQIVALYFRMIPQIDEDEYKDSYKVSREVLNLPVHQDIQMSDLKEMCVILKNILKELRSEI